MYIKVKTQTQPATLPIAQAARLSNRSPQYVNDETKRGNLDYGFAYDELTEHPEATDFDKETQFGGQKVIVANEKWYQWLERKRINRRKERTNK